MLGTDDGVLVYVGDAVVVCEGVGEPVGGAGKVCFCVEILGFTFVRLLEIFFWNGGSRLGEFRCLRMRAVAVL